HHHAGAAAERGVVDRAVAVGGPVAQVVDGDVHQAARARLADEGELERREVVGKDRDDVDPSGHRASSASSASAASRPAGGSMTTWPPSTSTTGTIAVTNGTSVRAPSGSTSTSTSWAGRCCTPATVPTTRPSGSRASSPASCSGYQASSSGSGSASSTTP